jgi:hypothetical protein
MSAEKDLFQAIANEIIEMSERDQAMRKSGQWDSSIDVENTRRMKENVQQIGWPTRSRGGKRASSMAWLLVQHAAHNQEFQKMCLKLMQEQPEGEVDPMNIAYLEDRLREEEGRAQLYGTQFRLDAQGNAELLPIEDPERVDERRKSVGMGTLAEYTNQMEQLRHARMDREGK